MDNKPAQNGAGRVFFKAEHFMDYYGWTRGQFEYYRKLGMPCRKVMGQWHGHSANVDLWFQHMTRANSSKVPAQEGEDLDADLDQ